VLTSKDKEDHFPGTVITAGGVLCLVAQIPILGLLGKIALGIGAVALIGIGVWNGVKFILGLKSRS
jgi:hypothetical protein